MFNAKGALQSMGIRRPADILSALLVMTSGGLLLHSNHLRSSLEDINISASSASSGADTYAQIVRQSAASEVNDRQMTSIDLRQLTGRAAPPINITAQAEQQDLLVFTKIGRCGSTALTHVLQRLATRNRFRLHRDKPYRQRSVLPTSIEEARAVASEMNSLSRPAAVVQAIGFLDFSIASSGRPLYVSMIRDPIEQAHSWFYWMRAPFAIVERALAHHQADAAVEFMPRASYLKKNYAACIRSGDAECNYQAGSTRVNHPIRAFCAQTPYCPVLGNSIALSVAKRVVDENYAVVGLVEEWTTSLVVMEKYVPAFFTGATEIYSEQIAQNKTLRDENFYRPKMTSNIRSLLREAFSVELEFYEFIKQRLHNQFEQLKATS